MAKSNKKKSKSAIQMGKLQTFWLNSRRIFAISTKPTRKQFFAMMKICLVGLAIIGGLSFVVQLITSVVSPAPAGGS
jgi:protein transport protein SEC61 subunit gamma and related proteins